jgi:hypothetical protein
LEEPHQLAARLHVRCAVKEDHRTSLRWNYLNIVYLHIKIAKTFTPLTNFQVQFSNPINLGKIQKKARLLITHRVWCLSLGPSIGSFTQTHVYYSNSHVQKRLSSTPEFTRVFLAFSRISSRSLQRCAACSAAKHQVLAQTARLWTNQGE